MADSDKFFFVRLKFDDLFSAPIYNANAVDYLWGPKSGSWGRYKKKYVDPLIQSKKEGMAWGDGYGLLRVNHCKIKKIFKNDDKITNKKFLVRLAMDVFKDWLNEFVKDKIYLIKKTGLLTVSGNIPKVEILSGKVYCTALVGLWFVPMPLKDLTRWFPESPNEWYPNWVIDSKRAKAPVPVKDVWFEKEQ